MGIRDLGEVGLALQRIFPRFGNIAPIRVLGDGFCSVVIETAEGHVFRVAKNPAAMAAYAKELRLLPALSACISTAIPHPRWYAEPSDDFPYGVIGHVKLPGKPLVPELLSSTNVKSIASDIADFLLDLHRFPVDEARELGLAESEDPISELEELRDGVLPALGDLLTGAEYRVVEYWWDEFLNDRQMRHHTPVLQHGDLWYENILVDESAGNVTGILDFGDARIGDAAQDFATQLHLGVDFAAAVIDTYRLAGGTLNKSFPHRIQRFWEFREFDGIQFAIQFDDTEELRDSVRKLRCGPILSGQKKFG